ncbi:hypothetical protein J7M00_06825 [bacterium]|nr:hypothetical protein [bacterium]
MSEVVKIKEPNKVLGRARERIEKSAQTWASETINGFMTKWQPWYTQFEIPALLRLRLPKKTNDIKQNVINRVVPVAEAISRASAMYRQQKNAQLAPQVVPPTPAV